MITPDRLLLMAEDDDGHALLVEDLLRENGFTNKLLRFSDGQEVLDFLAGQHAGGLRPEPGRPYLLLLDVRMPKVDGVEVLRQVKASAAWRCMPVIMLTTTDDPREVARCHDLGCSAYISKPLDYAHFAEAVRRLGLSVDKIAHPGSDEPGLAPPPTP